MNAMHRVWAAVLMAVPTMVQGAGVELYELATPDVGLASAGYAARAQDASTLFKNPAGMSRLQGAQFQGGLQLTYGNARFSPNQDTSPSLGSEDGGNAIGAIPALSGFYVHPLGERVRVGFGTFSYFGLAQKYDSDWVGRYFIQEGALVGVSLMPSLSVQVNEWLSVGAGLNAMAGYFKTQVAVNNLEPALGDGQLEVQDTAWGFGANVGLLVEPRQGTRFGLTYLSAVDLDFSDRPSFQNLGPGLGAVLGNPRTLDVGMTVPQGVMFGVFQEVSEKWAVMLDVGWQNWNRFGKVDVGVQSSASSDLTVDANYQDTWHVAVGAQYRLSEKWRFSGGFAYDSSAVSDENRSVTTPMGEAYRFGVGAEWQLNQAINLGASYEFLWAGDMAVDQGSEPSLRGRVAGSYENSWFSFMAIHMTWKF